jgi:hypothetical protein
LFAATFCFSLCSNAGTPAIEHIARVRELCV